MLVNVSDLSRSVSSHRSISFYAKLFLLMKINCYVICVCLSKIHNKKFIFNYYHIIHIPCCFWRKGKVSNKSVEDTKQLILRQCSCFFAPHIVSAIYVSQHKQKHICGYMWPMFLCGFIVCFNSVCTGLKLLKFYYDIVKTSRAFHFHTLM